LETFGQITSDPNLAALLSTISNGNPNNIDAWVGMLAEDHAPGSSVGPTIRAIIASQFQRLRDGDRLFYRGDAAGLYNDIGVLDPAIAAIVDLDTLRLSDILAWNSGASRLQANVFFAVPEPHGLALIVFAVGALVTGVRRRVP
jgi:peroxidase